MANQYKDLSHTAEQIDSTIDGFSSHSADTVAHVTILDRENWDSKVDAVSGKGLSTEDYTTAEKTKLAGLSNYDDSAVRGLIATKADASDLTAETTARENADTALQTALDGKTTVAAIYGIGTSLVSGDDLDNYTAIGRYYAGTSISDSILNKPVVSTYGFELTVENNTTSTRIIQTITYNTSNALHIGKLYKRWYTSDGWSAWYVYEGTAIT